jgi:two-component system CheB/CheR fusion protein
MEVVEAVDGMRVEPEHVYLIPPGVYLAVQAGVLSISAPRARHGARLPFDFFLRSLAREYGEDAMCGVLSGTGADGTLGSIAVNAQGGFVVIQDPKEATYDGMPESALAAVHGSLVKPIVEMPDAFIKHSRQHHQTQAGADPAGRAISAAALARIIAILKSTTTHDFSSYKPGTLHRRIERRMATISIADSDAYQKLLSENPGEREVLAKSLLINVSRFLRDAPAFEVLARDVIPDLVRSLPQGRPLRIWVPGCSTGEEAYSIAMLCLDEMASTDRSIKLQVFASDIDPDCIAFARDGVYSAQIDADVGPDRLARYFLKTSGGYRVTRELREAIVFTTQNLLADPPFSGVDMISCRNVLIYLSPDSQKRILTLFHCALRQNGILFLGSSESVGHLGDKFLPASKSACIFRHRGRSRADEIEFPRRSGGQGLILPAKAPQSQQNNPRQLSELARRTLMDAFVPASVLINDKRIAVHFFGPVDRYLKIASGDVHQDILLMARAGLRSKLRVTIEEARGLMNGTATSSARVEHNGSTTDVAILVRPLVSDGEPYFLLSFKEETPAHSRTPGEPEVPIVRTASIADLEQELSSTRGELNSVISELDIANEEHKAINEEAMSINEEFQSVNEELETSKEELQSLNEELNALNSQLQETVERQRATSDDLSNILNSSNVATLFLDRALRIRFFTPEAKSLFSVIEIDLGRPLSDITHRFGDDELLSDARAVLETVEPRRREIKADNGLWFIRSILPYRNGESQVEGVIITFSGISEMKAAQQEIQAARAYSDSIIATIGQPLVVLDRHLRVISASSSFCRIFGVEPDATVGRKLREISAHLDMPQFRGFVASFSALGAAQPSAELTIELPTLGRAFVMTARLVRDVPSAAPNFLLTIDDVTEAKRTDDNLEAAKAQAERANTGKSRFLAAASHDLRQPLQTISLLQGILLKKVKDEASQKLLLRLDETVTTMSSMLDKLLDINQLEAGIVKAKITNFSISNLLDDLQAEFTYLAREKGLDWRVVKSSLVVESDPRLLEQLLRNLISNAIKYTPTGKVVLGCRRRGDKVRIEVLDTGIGIPADEVERIFEEFHQLDNPARESSRGLGLGLSIVQRLAELLEHSIDVRSVPQCGSAFGIEVPAGRRAALSGTIRLSKQPSDGAPMSAAILVVEDDPAVREMIKLLLEADGHRVEVAADGADALRIAEKYATPPDLLIADYNLPGGLTGLDAISHVHARLRTKTPAIVLTGDISTETLLAIARHGYVHLYKPVKANQLTGLIQKLIARPGIAAPDRGEALMSVHVPLQSAGTIFVVDDDVAVREAMRDLLQEHGYAVEAFASGEAFLQAGRTQGCLLVDARMPGMSGLELMQRLAAMGCRLPTIMITGNGDVAMAVGAMKAGARDFIEKPIGHVELLASIAGALARGGQVLELSGQRELAASIVASLTGRQRQIMDLVLAGHPSKNIAADLGISQRTVDNHRAAIMKKTGSKSIPALIRLAISADY